MDMIEIFGLQFLMSLLVYSLLAAWIISPPLREKPVHEAVFWLALPHAFRHLGLVFLVPGVVATTMPGPFNVAAAYGDLAAAVLAILTITAARMRWKMTIPLAWILTIVGTADLANALRQIEAVPHFQSAWYIPTFVVPLLLVTHFLMAVRLLRKPAPVREPTPQST